MDRLIPDIPLLVDTHAHIWNDDIPRLWLTPLSALKQPHLLPDYEKYSINMPLSKLILMETAVDEGYNLKEAQWFSQQKSPFLSGMVISLPMNKNIEDALRDALSFDRVPVVGIREVLQDKPFDYCLSKEFIKSIGVLNEKGIPFDVCIRSDLQLKSVTKLATMFPNMKFMLDHCGKPDLSGADENRKDWAGNIQKLAKIVNFHVKLSGLLSEIEGEWKKEQIIQVLASVIQCWGWERCHYGSDWPLCEGKIKHEDYVGLVVEAIKRTGGGISELERVLATNSIKFYNLK